MISAESTIEVERAQASQKVFTQARKSEQSILQELSRESTQAPDSVIWVVDGSYAMTPHMSDILEALENWDSEITLQVLVASDQSPFIAPDHTYKICSPQEALSYLSLLEPSGGQDNLAALTQAWALARGTGRAACLVVSWTTAGHAGRSSSLQQQMERSRGSIQLISKGIFPVPQPHPGESGLKLHTRVASLWQPSGNMAAVAR